MCIYVVLLSSKAVAVIPQRDRVRQLKHYIISAELFWKDEPEEKETGARMVRGKNSRVELLKVHAYSDSGASQTVSY